MTDELDLIAALSPEQIVERAKALQLEVEYWQQVLDDASAINDAVRQATGAILDSTTAVLVLVPIVDAAALNFAETIVNRNRAAIEALNIVGDRLGGMLELAAGRTKSLEPISDALLRAAGDDPHSTDER